MLLSWSHTSITSNSSESSTSYTNTQTHSPLLHRKFEFYRQRHFFRLKHTHRQMKEELPWRVPAVSGVSVYICKLGKLSAPVFSPYSSPLCLRRYGDGAHGGLHPTITHRMTWYYSYMQYTLTGHFIRFTCTAPCQSKYLIIRQSHSTRQQLYAFFTCTRSVGTCWSSNRAPEWRRKMIVGGVTVWYFHGTFWTSHYPLRIT